jgi:hypothetical protein
MFGSDFPAGRLWTSFDAIFDGFKRSFATFRKPSNQRFSMTMRGESIASTRSDRSGLTFAGALRFASGKPRENEGRASQRLWRQL